MCYLLSVTFSFFLANQLQTHLSESNILHRKQFYFRRNRSATDAGVELLETVFSAWEDKLGALGTVCGFNDTLVRKLYQYGNRNTALNLLTSYLILMTLMTLSLMS